MVGSGATFRTWASALPNGPKFPNPLHGPGRRGGPLRASRAAPLRHDGAAARTRVLETTCMSWRVFPVAGRPSAPRVRRLHPEPIAGKSAIDLLTCRCGPCIIYHAPREAADDGATLQKLGQRCSTRPRLRAIRGGAQRCARRGTRPNDGCMAMDALHGMESCVWYDACFGVTSQCGSPNS